MVTSSTGAVRKRKKRVRTKVVMEENKLERDLTVEDAWGTREKGEKGNEVRSYSYSV